MPIIVPNTPIVTQINVFTVPPDGQQPLIDNLAMRVIAHLVEHGLIDANHAYGTAHPGLYEVVHTLDRTA